MKGVTGGYLCVSRCCHKFAEVETIEVEVEIIEVGIIMKCFTITRSQIG